MELRSVWGWEGLGTTQISDDTIVASYPHSSDSIDLPAVPFWDAAESELGNFTYPLPLDLQLPQATSVPLLSYRMTHGPVLDNSLLNITSMPNHALDGYPLSNLTVHSDSVNIDWSHLESAGWPDHLQTASALGTDWDAGANFAALPALDPVDSHSPLHGLSCSTLLIVDSDEQQSSTAAGSTSGAVASAAVSQCASSPSTGSTKELHRSGPYACSVCHVVRDTRTQLSWVFPASPPKTPGQN